MKITILTIISLLNFYILAQNPEIIEFKLKKESEGGYKYKIEFSALKSDTSIKHGEYKRYNILKDLEETGFYKYGQKDSIWKTYSAGKMVNSVGIYKNNKKEGLWNYYINIPKSWDPTPLKSGNYKNDSIDGIWTYYYRNGEIEQKFDHTTNSIIYYSKNYENKKWIIKENNEVQNKIIEVLPMLIGGNVTSSENWQKMDFGLMSKLSNNDQDVSYGLSFWIKPNGETYAYEMIKSINENFDKYIIEFYKANYKWIPGKINGQNIECKMIINNGYVVKM